MQSYRDPWIKKAKWLTQALIVSGTLNVGLLSTFVYFSLTERKGSLEERKKFEVVSEAEIADQLGLQQLITKYSSLSMQDLLLRLGNTEHVESGYTRRDLALACLAAYHHFNLEKALGGHAIQKRTITYTNTGDGQKRVLTVFPGLADYQFQAISHFAKTEAWPLTAEGLFLELKKNKLAPDEMLLESFYLTPECHFLSLLFAKTGVQLKKQHLVTVLLDADWETLAATTEHLRKTSQFTPEVRRQLLLRLAKNASKLGAKILLEVDSDYCLKQLDNAMVVQLCDLLGDRSSPTFLKSLLNSPRSDEVWQKAASLLYEIAAEKVPRKLKKEEVKMRFIDLKEPHRSHDVASQTYQVVSGDSLWKIAGDYGTTVNALRLANDLKSDTLKIGQTLIIPQ